MPILGDATLVFARVARSTSNALRVQLATPDGTELAHAQQKGGLGVLLGFNNGGKGDYTLSSTAGDELRIAVVGTTTITKQNTPGEKSCRLMARHGWKPATLKAPSAGAVLELRAPVAPEMGDVLAAACVDFSVLPRGYIA